MHCFTPRSVNLGYGTILHQDANMLVFVMFELSPGIIVEASLINMIAQDYSLIAFGFAVICIVFLDDTSSSLYGERDGVTSSQCEE